MRPPSILTRCLVLATIVALFTHEVKARCYTYENPLEDKLVPVQCEDVKEEKKATPVAPGTNMFTIQFTCNTADQAACAKAKAGFDTATQILSGTLRLNTPVIVNATYLDFCTVLGQCPQNGLITLGQARPQQLVPLMDNDNTVRLYPQALAKQFQLTTHPAFAPADIMAQFNSGFSWYFSGDPTPIQPSQADFLYVIVHELVHGLGFTSAWNDYLFQTPQALTPLPDLTDTIPSTFKGFKEFALDKYMYLTKTNKPGSLTAAEISKFSPSPNQFNTLDEFVAAFSKSQQFPIAQSMMASAVTPNSFIFLVHGSTGPTDGMILETGINPYRRGSSVSHADNATYIGSQDFLMCWQVIPGVTLDTAVQRAGNFTGGAIGPKLKAVLETLGYSTVDFTSTYKPQPAPSDTQGNQTGSTTSGGSSPTNSPTTHQGAGATLSTPNIGLMLAIACMTWMMGRGAGF